MIDRVKFEFEHDYLRDVFLCRNNFQWIRREPGDKRQTLSLYATDSRTRAQVTAEPQEDGNWSGHLMYRVGIKDDGKEEVEFEPVGAVDFDRLLSACTTIVIDKAAFFEPADHLDRLDLTTNPPTCKWCGEKLMNQTHNLTPKDKDGKPVGPAVTWTRVAESVSPYGTHTTGNQFDRFTLHNIQELPAFKPEAGPSYSGEVRRESVNGTDLTVAADTFLGLMQEATNLVYFRFIAEDESRYETRSTEPKKRKRPKPAVQVSSSEEIAQLRERVAVLEYQVKTLLDVDADAVARRFNEGAMSALAGRLQEADGD